MNYKESYGNSLPRIILTVVGFCLGQFMFSTQLLTLNYLLHILICINQSPLWLQSLRLLPWDCGKAMNEKRLLSFMLSHRNIWIIIAILWDSWIMINSVLTSSILLQPYWIKEKLLKIFSVNMAMMWWSSVISLQRIMSLFILLWSPSQSQHTFQTQHMT